MFAQTVPGMTSRPDAVLWPAYETCSTDAERGRVAELILRAHTGFLRLYVRETAFPYWDADLRAEYFQEVVLVALARIPEYNRRRAGYGEQVAAFPTYLRPYLLEVRWKLAAREEGVGKETIRMRADGQRYIRSRAQQGLPVPTWTEVADVIGAAHGKRLTAKRAAALCCPARLVRPDAGTRSDDARGSSWDQLAAGQHAPSAEDEALGPIEAADLRADVAAALAATVTSPLDAAIVAERLMCEGKPATLKGLGEIYGVPAAAVREAEERLQTALRALLA